MSDAERLDELRRLFLSAPEAAVTRVVAVTLSLTVFVLVLWLVRRRALREEYTPIWIGAATAMLLLSVYPPLLYAITRAIGAWTPSSTIFFLGEMFLLAICLHFGVRLSRANLQIKNLAQEVALLRARVQRVESGEVHPPAAGEP
jgi:hypothetical protein